MTEPSPLAPAPLPWHTSGDGPWCVRDPYGCVVAEFINFQEDGDLICAAVNGHAGHVAFVADIRAVAVKMIRLAPYYETIQPFADEIQAAIERLEKETP